MTEIHGQTTTPIKTIFPYLVRNITTYEILLSEFISERSILLNAKSKPTDDWEDSDGVKLNYTNWGIGHPAQRDYLILIGIKLVLIQNLLFKLKFSFSKENHKN